MPRGKTLKGYKPTKLDRAAGEFFAMPSKNRPATTTAPSVRNFVNNIKSLPSAYKTVGSQIKTALTSGSNRVSIRKKRK